MQHSDSIYGLRKRFCQFNISDISLMFSKLTLWVLFVTASMSQNKLINVLPGKLHLSLYKVRFIRVFITRTCKINCIFGSFCKRKSFVMAADVVSVSQTG